jgi:hypothetical protein
MASYSGALAEAASEQRLDDLGATTAPLERTPGSINDIAAEVRIDRASA